jgi:hypothetical protein
MPFPMLAIRVMCSGCEGAAEINDGHEGEANLTRLRVKIPVESESSIWIDRGAQIRKVQESRSSAPTLQDLNAHLVATTRWTYFC